MSKSDLQRMTTLAGPDTWVVPGPSTPSVRQLQTPDVAVIGLGYVGLTLAVSLAAIGQRVLGYEANPRVRQGLAVGEAHFRERGLDEPFRRHLGRELLVEPMLPSRLPPVVIICVGTPVDDEAHLPNLEYLEQATRAIAERLSPETLVIVRSTVPVGTTRRLVLPLLQQYVVEPKLAFCPERTIQGQALSELRSLPQIVGGITPDVAAEARTFFARLASQVVTVSSLEAAEMIKLLCNAHTDMLYGFGNQVALMAEALGLDADELIASANLHYPRPDLARPGFVGGSCLVKDPYLLIRSVEGHGYFPPMIAAARQLNESMPARVAERVLAALADRGKHLADCRILLSGLAYKGQPETDDLRGGSAGPIASALREHTPHLFGHDFVVPSERIAADVGLEPVSLADGFANADAVVILNNHSEYARCAIRSLVTTMRRPAVVFDAWGVFADVHPGEVGGVTYMRLGHG